MLPSRFYTLTTMAITTAIAVSLAQAEPTSGPITISQLRPYIGGNTVFVYLGGGVGPCGALSGAYSIYTIDVSSPAGKAAYSAALMAIASGKQVQLEVNAGACGAPYPGLQSVYIGT